MVKGTRKTARTSFDYNVVKSSPILLYRQSLHILIHKTPCDKIVPLINTDNLIRVKNTIK